MGNEQSRLDQEAAEAEAARLAAATQETFDLDNISDRDESPLPEEVPPSPTPPPTIQPSKGKAKKKTKSKTKRRKKQQDEVPEEVQPEPVRVFNQPADEEQRRYMEENEPEMFGIYAMSDSSILGEDIEHAQSQHGHGEEEEAPPISHSVVEIEFPVVTLRNEEREDVDMNEHEEILDTDPLKQHESEDEISDEESSGQNTDNESVLDILNGEGDEDGLQPAEHDRAFLDSSVEEAEPGNSNDGRTLSRVSKDSANKNQETSEGSEEEAPQSLEERTDEAEAEMNNSLPKEPVDSNNFDEELDNNTYGVDGDQEDQSEELPTPSPAPSHYDAGDDDEQGQAVNPLSSGSRNVARFVSIEVPAMRVSTAERPEDVEGDRATDRAEPVSQKPLNIMPFKCLSCTSAFSQKHKLDRHMLAHGPPQFYCPYCPGDQEKRFHRKDKTIEHIRRCHSTTQLAVARLMSLRIDPAKEVPSSGKSKAPKTSETFALNEPLGEQIETADADSEALTISDSVWPCPVAQAYYCTSTFETKQAAKKHARQHDTTGRFVCPVCKHGAVRQSNLKQHKLKYHSEVSIKYAKELFKQGKDDMGSQETHYQISCPCAEIFECSEIFDDLDAAERHCTMVHEPDLHCPVCARPCVDEKKLFSHKMKVHPAWELREARTRLAATLGSFDDPFAERVEDIPDSGPDLQSSASQDRQSPLSKKSSRRPRSKPQTSSTGGIASSSGDHDPTSEAQSQGPTNEDAEGFPCPHAEDYGCTKTFKWMKTAVRHGKTHEWDYPCICDKIFPRQDTLMDHFHSSHPASQKYLLEPQAKVPARTRLESSKNTSDKRGTRHSQRSTTRVSYHLDAIAQDDSAVTNDDEDAQVNADDDNLEISHEFPRKRKRNESDISPNRTSGKHHGSQKRQRLNANAQQTFTLEIPSEKLIDRCSTRLTPPAVDLGSGDDADTALPSGETPNRDLSSREDLASKEVVDISDSDAYEDRSDSDKSDKVLHSSREKSRSKPTAIHRSRPNYPAGSDSDILNVTIESDLEDPVLFCRTCRQHFKSPRARKQHDKDKKAHLNLEKCGVCARRYHSYSALRAHKIDTGHYFRSDEKSKDTGHFTQLEVMKIKKWRRQLCREHSLSKAQFNDMMSDTRKRRVVDWSYKFISRKELLVQFYDVLPGRSRRSMQTYRDIHFHNGEKGAEWALEDDRDILRLHQELGPRWVEIGARVSRPCQDVRRRYQSTLQYAGKLEHGEWTAEESVRFSKAIEEVRKIIDRPPGDNFNWQAGPARKSGPERRSSVLITGAQCMGLESAGRWFKAPRNQRLVQRNRTKMENRLSGRRISIGRPSDLSREYIIDSDEEAGLVTTPAGDTGEQTQDHRGG